MSDSALLIAITSLGVASGLFVYYASEAINRVGDQIVVGFVGEHAVSLQQRWLMFYGRWVT